jgi:hypothetical protein
MRTLRIPMLTDEEVAEIKQRISNSFKPLRCVVEIWDYKTKLRFEVFDKRDNGIFENSSVVLSTLKDDQILEAIIEQAKYAMKAKGVAFDLD